MLSVGITNFFTKFIFAWTANIIPQVGEHSSNLRNQSRYKIGLVAWSGSKIHLTSVYQNNLHEMQILTMHVSIGWRIRRAYNILLARNLGGMRKELPTYQRRLWVRSIDILGRKKVHFSQLMKPLTIYACSPLHWRSCAQMAPALSTANTPAKLSTTWMT